MLGARVIAAASTEAKRKFAAEHGADATVDYTQANWRDALKELTGGHGADVIFDPVGGEVSVQAFRSIAWNGRHLVVGFAAGSIPALPFNLPLLKGGVLTGVDVAQIARREPEAREARHGAAFHMAEREEAGSGRRPGISIRRFSRRLQGHAESIRARKDGRQDRLAGPLGRQLTSAPAAAWNGTNTDKTGIIPC